MNRIFHARIAWYQYLILIILGANTFALLWMKHILLALLMALALIVIIEMVIHTTYTVTSGNELILSYGRFTRKKIIPIKEIVSMEKCHSMKFGNFSVTEYVLIQYGREKYASVVPVKEREFMELVEKRRMKEEQPINE